MSLKLIVTFIALGLSSTTFSKTYSAFLGAGGEPEGATTMFDGEISKMGRISKDLSDETVISLDGGHSKTEKIIKDKFAQPNASFTETNFEKIISGYEKRIKEGGITHEDQLLLVIDTHGAERADYKDEKTHSIALAGSAIQNLNTGAGSTIFSLDRLESLAKLAEEKGVKLAIIDLSCHSGSSLPLRNSKTCVISASGPHHYAYGGGFLTFPRRLFKYMKKGTNLEEAFLKARGANWDLAFPMISTPAGLEVNNKLYGPITPYLYYYSDTADKLSSFIRAEAGKGEACEAPQELQSLQHLIEEARSFKSIAREAQLSDREAIHLSEALKEYYGFQKKLKDDLNALNVPDMQKKEKFCSDSLKDTWKVEGHKLITIQSHVQECIEYTTKEILQGDFSWARDFYKKNANAEFTNFYGAQYKNVEQVMKRKEELTTNYPDLKKWENFFYDQSKLENQTYSLARKVAYASQHLYETLYQEYSLEKKGNNPCSDFVL